MALEFYVGGPVVVKVGIGSGSPPALVTLGYTESGVDLSISEAREPVRSDAAGTVNPADFQYMGAIANITVPLVSMELAELVKLRERAGASVFDGLAGPPGRLVAGSGDSYKIVLAGAKETWRFYWAAISGQQRVNLGTKYGVYNLTFQAWCYVPPTALTANAIRWYDHLDQA